ncbi:MAG: hypothetical protein IJ717_12130 [Treponema sp.]|nr:hypothetical protein [Treponema sp.]
MKKIGLLFLLPTFFFFSCSDDDRSEDRQLDDNQQSYTEEKSGGDVDGKETLVALKNKSQFKVEVYSNPERDSSSLVCSIECGSEKKVEDKENLAGSVYYLSYIVDVGVEIPWSDTDSYIVATPKTGETVEASISDPKSMATSDCFVVVENDSSQQVVFKQGASELFPENDKSTTVLSANGGSGVYKISSAFFGNFPTFKLLTIHGEEIEFPAAFSAFEKGKIFTIVVSDSSSSVVSSLKSISPFDIDTQKQIWSSKVFPKKNNVECVRRAYDLGDGSFFAGSGDFTTFYIQSFDVYGSEKVAGEFTVLEEDVITVSVVDVLQCSDKEYLVLLRGCCDSDDSDYYPLESYFYLGKFNIETQEKKIVNLTEFAQGLNFENFYFYGNLIKGAVCELDSSKFSVCGSVFDSGGRMRYFSAVVDFSSNEPQVSSYWVSDDYTEYEVLRTLTSSYFDGSNLYTCGFDSFDEKYGEGSDVVHKGVVYKFNSDLSNAEEIYSNEKSLFFGIAGKGGSFYVCGEAMGSSGDNDLYGCFLSSDMVGENSDPLKYFSTKKNLWFTQINFTNYGLVLCGVNSEDSQGKITGDVDGVLTCVSPSGKKLWENEYSSYYKIVSMAENNIGTQILHLKTKSDANKIISTDLLGKEK